MLVTGAVWVAACYPTGVETINDLSTVSTAHNSTVDFKTFQTFAVANRVYYIELDGGAASLDPSLGDPLISTVASEMSARGYTQITPSLTTQPDLALVLGITTVTYTNIYYNYGWCYYWGYYYPYCSGWGWYYPPIAGVTQYEVGTLFIDMGRSNASAGRLDGLWVGAVRGILSGSTTADIARAQSGIKQAFTQSPYISR
jgi:hypothetical protein